MFFFEKKSFLWETQKLVFFNNEGYNISENFLNTFFDPSDKFKAIFEVLGLKKNFCVEVEILSLGGQILGQNTAYFTLFFGKKNFFYERHENFFLSKNYEDNIS